MTKVNNVDDYGKVIILDADGVLMNLHEVLEETLCNTYPYFSMNNVKSYDFNKMLKAYPKMTKYVFGEDFYETFEKDEYLCLGAPRKEILTLLGNREIFDKSTPYPNIVECIEFLANKGVTFIIHSQGMNQNVCESKVEVLCHYFGHIPNLNIEVSLGTKKPVLIGDAIIEDNPSALMEYHNVYINFKRKIKIDRYLIDMPFNQGNVYQFALATQNEANVENFFPIDAIAKRVPNAISALMDMFPTTEFPYLKGKDYIYKENFK